MRRSLLGATVLAAGALGGAVLGYLAERAVVDPASEPEVVADGPRRRLRQVIADDGTLLSVVVSGQADAPAIVLVHGMSLSHEIWTVQRAELERSYQVVTVDLRGHGDSTDAASGDYSAEALGGDVCAVIDTLTDQPCVVVGHSMGGMAVMAALAQRPDLLEERVAGIVLVNTAASAVISGLGGGSVAATIAFARERVRSSLIGRALYGGLDDAGLPRGNDLATLATRMFGVGSDAPEDAVRQVRRLVLDSRPHVAGEMWRTAGTLDQLAVARVITVPTLIIAGARDRVLPVHHSRRLANTLTDAELVELPGVGHVAMLERPDVVTMLLDGFARRVLGAPSGYGEPRHTASGG
jgi:pimeloyl-ACP methyl ester carboxylesterase